MNIEGLARIFCDECGSWEEEVYDPSYTNVEDVAFDLASGNDWIIDADIDGDYLSLCSSCRNDVAWCEICEDGYTFEYAYCFDTVVALSHEYCMEVHHENLEEEELIEPYVQYCPDCEHQLFTNPVVGNRKPLLKLKASA